MWEREARLRAELPTPDSATRPPRVLVVATDRRFRAVASTLLTQRGCEVSVHPVRDDIRAHAARERIDVVVLDATASLTGAAETAATFPATEWEMLADGASVIETIPLRNPDKPETIPGYYAVMAPRR